jgi:hypothetical protein
MSALDANIDDLYRQPLNEFTSARNALAKSLSGADAQRVRALAKPTVVPWAVNQVYWRARAAYDRLMKSGERLRTAQIAALEGRPADVRAASETHRRAIAEAVAEAERLAATSGSKPNPDALARTFEALSLTTKAPDAPGRLTDPLQPAGFEALAGLTPKAPPGPAKAGHGRHQAETAHGSDTGVPLAKPRGRQADRDLKREREEAEAARVRAATEARRARKREAALKSAGAAVARAEAAERLARTSWERAHDALLEARRTLSELKSAT